MKKYGFKQKQPKVSFPPSKKKKVNWTKILKRFKINLKKFKFFRLLPGLLLVGTILWVGNKLVINSPSNTIYQVQFPKKVISYYDNPDLFSKISDFLSGKNIILASNQLGSFVTSLKEQYPLIDDIFIKKNAPNSVIVDIKYHSPSFIALLSWEAWGSIDQTFFPIPLTSTLLKNKDIPTFQLPDYYNRKFPLSWFFFKIKENTLTKQLIDIKKHLSPQKIIYLPGWSKYEVLWKDKILYFDGTKNIQDQIKNFLLLLENQNKLKEPIRQRQKADIWSLSWAIILTP